MMSNALYRLGRFAVRRPWAVIGSWLVLSVLVVGAAATVGQQLDNSFGAPGLDSQEATDLLATADAGAGGLTAQVVLTPHDTTATFFDSTELQAELAAIQEDVRNLPHVIKPAIRHPPRRSRSRAEQSPKTAGLHCSACSTRWWMTSRRPISRTSRNW